MDGIHVKVFHFSQDKNTMFRLQIVGDERILILASLRTRAHKIYIIIMLRPLLAKYFLDKHTELSESSKTLY